MNLTLVGHAYRYGVEQMLMTLFPGEKPSYGGAPEDGLCLELQEDGAQLFAQARLNYEGKTVYGESRVDLPPQADTLSYDREAQKAVKLAFYRAALQVLPHTPRWGSLTGVRPVKIPTRRLKLGGSEADCVQELVETYLVAPQEAQIAATCARFAHKALCDLEPQAVALYIGIPFCPTRCAYCSFVSAAVGQQTVLLEPYVQTLIQEVRATGALLQARGLRVRSVYIGGGTPTTLSARALKELLEQLFLHVDLSQCSEFTVEAGRPDTITPEKLRVLERFPIQRISVNPQTMHDETLRAIGRGHTTAQTRQALALVQESRIPLINMDLIIGLPGETPADFRASLDEVIAYAPANITVHTLAIKRSAALTAHSASFEMLSEMYEYAIAALTAAGYQPYYLYRQKEMGGSFANIGWTREGGESLYNLCMMEELCTTVALGATGISKLVNRETGKIERINNPKYATEYVERIAHILSKKEQVSWLLN